MRVEQADPEIAFDLIQLPEEAAKGWSAGRIDRLAGSRFLLPEIHAEVSGVLTDQVEFFCPLFNQGARFRHDRPDGPAAVASAHLWDHAEAARMVAALGNLQVDRVAGCELEARGVVVGNVARFARDQVERAARSGGRPLEHLADDAGKLGDLVESDKGINFGDFAFEFLVVALGEAAADDDFLGRPGGQPPLVHFEDGVDRFFFGLVDEAAGVDHEHIGFVGFAGQVEIIFGGPAEHDLGIDQIFGTTEADHADLRARVCRGHADNGDPPGSGRSGRVGSVHGRHRGETQVEGVVQIDALGGLDGQPGRGGFLDQRRWWVLGPFFEVEPRKLRVE